MSTPFAGNPGDILDSLSTGIVLADANWRIRYVNQSLVSLVDCSAEELLGKHTCLLSSRMERRGSAGELLHHLVRLTLSPPESLHVKTVSLQVPERKFLRITAQPAAPTAGYLLTFTDATHEGEVDEMKSEFISVVSHEIRTPMTSIKGSLELLLGGYVGELPAEADELLGISLTAVDRLIRLINDLLDISKIESGKMELHLNRLNVAQCIEKSLRSIRSLAETNHVSMAAEQAENLPDVIADRDRLEQVITNLLSNALKYSPPESAVRVRVYPANNRVRVSVSDQGPGIPVEQLEKVFEWSHQLEGAQ